MTVRLIAVVLLAMTLAGCGSLGCGAAANDRASAGACTTHITFLH